MKKRIVVGVDVAKLTFEARWRGGAGEFGNDIEGFEQFAEAIPAKAHVVMEVTGTYHQRLAHWLYHHGYAVSVVNPAQPAYYARMKLKRGKTDPMDAGVLQQYGEAEPLPLWSPMETVIVELNQLDRHLAGLHKDHTQVVNRLEALTQHERVNSFALADLESQECDLARRIRDCEREMERLVREHFGELYELLRTIPGIGRRTALMFIVLTDGFQRFPTAKQFTAYLGLTSFVRQSGTSIHGSGAITKMGNGRMRQLLYMAALTAKQFNPACQDFAARLAANGKPPKVIRVAVANKLIRQVFAVVEKQQAFSTAYA